MSVPKKRISKRRTRARRSHHALKKPSVATCPKCKQHIRPHHACASCGQYRERDVLRLQEKVEKKISEKSAKKAPAATSTDEKKEKKDKKKSS